MELKIKGFGSQNIQAQDLVLKINHDEATVIDIRSVNAFQEGHIVGAMNCPADNFEQKVNSLNKFKNKHLVIVCNLGNSAVKIAKQLKDQGFTQVSILQGGIQAWRTAGLPLQK